MSGLSDVLRRLAEGEEQALARLFDVLRIPSVSTLPEHAADCRRAAAWFRDRFAEMGFAATLRDTPGQPAMVARYEPPGGAARRVIYYGHYDVQPADPVDEWRTDPFEPALADGPNGRCVVARGAADDKGQVVAWMEAFRAHLAASGSLPADITVVIEGEEETGSLNFDGLLTAHAADFAGADVAVVSDGTMWNAETPAITNRLRGLVYLDVTLTTADQDAHSGLFGGSAPNAALAMCAILSGLKDDSGRVGFDEIYEDIADVPAAVLASWHALAFDETTMLAGLGATASSGEAGRHALERIWARPTADVNGLWSGFTGDGAKTIIPRQASAKVSFRLVPGQDPGKVVAGFRRFVERRRPPGARIDIDVVEAAPAVEMPADSRFLEDVAGVLEAEFGRRPVLIGCGGSLGAVESFKRVLGLPTLLFSFGLDDDRVHAPNEKFDLACFRHASRSHARLLQRWREQDAATMVPLSNEVPA